ncbi:MAG: N-6 DNA methylase [Candidatus Eremiobacteraeota bacterium]|nr:N-6 DNA methylase [Candidatus Eremiobacteraeota bacterium]
MARNTYRKIDIILKELLSYSSNMDFFKDDFREAENFLISASFYFLFNDSIALKKPTQIKKDIPSEDTIRELLTKYHEFHFSTDLKIDIEILKKILRLVKKERIIIPGLIHEYFLENFPNGKRIESKRKKTGTYYTPKWVADDIVQWSLNVHLQNKLDELRKCKNDCNYEKFVEIWKSISEIKILDPACGWGIFLVSVYRYMERFYRSAGLMAQKMLENQACHPFDDDDMLSDGYSRKIQFSIYLKEISSIGRDPSTIISDKNIYGYDIDKTALNIAKHLLDNQGDASVRNGSLQWNMLERDFILDFDKIKERFDLIVGNPPYFSIGGGGKGKTKTIYHSILKNHSYYGKYFRSQSDIFYYFILGGIEILKPGGRISFITPSYWLDNEYADTLKKLILEKCRIEEIINFDPLGVFRTLRGKKVNIDTTIFRYNKNCKSTDKDVEEITLKFIEQDMFSNKSPLNTPGKHSFPVYKTRLNPDDMTARGFLDNIRTHDLSGDNEKSFHTIFKRHDELSCGKWQFSRYNKILAKMKKNGETILPLGDISEKEYEKYRGDFEKSDNNYMTGLCKIGQGQETGLSQVFMIDKDTAEKLDLEKEFLKQNIKNRNILRFGLEYSDQLMIMVDSDEDLSLCPHIRNYLESHRESLTNRQRVRIGNRKWYEISIPQNLEIFENPMKILVPYRSPRNRFAIDRNAHLNDGGDVRAIVIKDEFRNVISYDFLLAVLNSRLISFWYMQSGKKKGKIYEYFTRPMSRIPICIPDSQLKVNIEEMSGEIQGLYQTYRNQIELSAQEKQNLKSKIENIENDIDTAVYKLYDINSLEIERIERYMEKTLPVGE